MELKAGQRARRELLADPWRSNLAIANEAGVNAGTVSVVRRDLELAGLIPAHDGRHRSASMTGYRLPAQPEALGQGSCVSHPHPDWWHSKLPSERQAAIYVCASCPVQVVCRDWALSLPAGDRAIYGGMTPGLRADLRRERTSQAAS